MKYDEEMFERIAVNWPSLDFDNEMRVCLFRAFGYDVNSVSTIEFIKAFNVLNLLMLIKKFSEVTFHSYDGMPVEKYELQMAREFFAKVRLARMRHKRQRRAFENGALIQKTGFTIYQPNNTDEKQD